MRAYEALLVLQPELEDEAINELLGRVGGVVTRVGGEVSRIGQLVDRKGNVVGVEENWSKRRLAYPIKGHAEGVFSILQLQLPPEGVEEIEAMLRIHEDVLRYLIVRDESDETGESDESDEDAPADGEATS